MILRPSQRILAPNLRIATASFNPLSIPLCKWWIDASNTASLYQDAGRSTSVTANSDPVGSWSDLVGGGYHANQATSSYRPLYKTGVLNGLPVIRFDGTNDRMLSSGVATTALDDFAVFGVTKANATTGDRSEIYIGDGNNGWGLMQSTATSKKGALYGGVGYLNSTIAAESTNFHIYLLRRVSGTAQVYMDGGTAIATSTSSPIAPTTRMAIGDLYDGTYPTSVDVAEVLIYESLSAASANRIGNYLAAKWSLSWSTI